MKNAIFTTTPRYRTGREELVVLLRKQFEKLLKQEMDAENILQWSREERKLKQAGKLPLLRSLRSLR